MGILHESLFKRQTIATVLDHFGKIKIVFLLGLENARVSWDPWCINPRFGFWSTICCAALLFGLLFCLISWCLSAVSILEMVQALLLHWLSCVKSPVN
ncbi:hypothetical protein CTI12_AA366920 [Artemisia annua]|uniref:Uncharacterized protein n=1 Tax=Artemisia annua TaxID=35608 RepID=A0A2U1MJ96_ARTAN|nr:hypothetical protein CTI12_AA366920 [Artemisia annua]